jgi:DNA-binding MarR family transcriptional regulator
MAHLRFLRFRWFFEGMVDSLPGAGLAHLPPIQCRVRSRVDRSGVRTAELANRLRVSRQAAHEQVWKLRRRGLVELRPDPTNRSAKLVVLTGLGGDTARQLRYVLQGMEELLSHRIGEEGLGIPARALELDRGSPLGPDPELESVVVDAEEPLPPSWHDGRPASELLP